VSFVVHEAMFKKIAQTIRKIPKGRVATYGDVAYAAGFPGAARQVAWALHQSRGLPWQRVVGAEGKILLPGEAGFEQRMRLQQEGVQFLGLRVNMKLHRHVWFEKRTAKKKQTARKNQRSRA
jgi:methylated-DNA-protein-cysteine methyltransferase related protein